MYYCDYCYTKDIDNYKIIRKYFKCPLVNDFKRHMETNKCIKNRKKVESLPLENKFTCEFCNMTFDSDGYNNHRERNKELFNILEYGKHTKLVTDEKLENFVEGEIAEENIKCNHYVLDYKGKTTRCRSLNDLVVTYCKKKNPNFAFKRKMLTT